MYLFEDIPGGSDGKALWFSPDVCPGVALLDHTVTLILVFGGTSILFSIVVAPIYIPNNSVGRFPGRKVFLT